MAIGGEDQNEDEDLDVVVVEDQNVQDQNQAMVHRRWSKI